jgi:amino acid transporter
MLGVLVLAGLPGLSYSLPVGAAIALLMLAAGISYRQTIRAHPQGGGSFIVASEGTRPRPRRGRQLANYLWTLHEHVAERLQPVLQSLPRVFVTSVPFHLAD